MVRKKPLTYRDGMMEEKANRRDPALLALGQQIRKRRTAYGISQENLAAAAGIARSYYGGIERGQRNLSALYLMRIAKTLQIEVGELFPPRDAFGPLLQAAGDSEAV